MAHENNTLRLTSAMISEPSFTQVFRGYNKRDVDQYARLVEAQLAASAAERQELGARVRALSEQLHQAHAELVELRRRPGPNDKLSFRHLGPRVEQILAEAERQADAVRLAAADGVAEERERMRADLAKAVEEHARTVREFERSMQTRRAEEDKEIGERLEAVRREVSEAHAYARKIRTEADQSVSAAQEEYKRLSAQMAGEVERIRAEATAQGQAIRARAEQEAASVAHAAETYARQTREEAEKQSHQTRAAAEQHAHQTTAAAEQAATHMRAQAEEHAAQVRLAAEKHAARLHANAPGGGPTSPAGPTAFASPNGAGPSNGSGASNAVQDSTPVPEQDRIDALPDGHQAPAADPSARHRANVRPQPTN